MFENELSTTAIAEEWLTLFKGRSVIRPNYKESSPEENHSDQSHGKIVISKKQVIRKSSNDEMAIKNGKTVFFWICCLGLL